MPLEASNGTGCNLLDEFKHLAVMVAVLSGTCVSIPEQHGGRMQGVRRPGWLPGAISVALLNSETLGNGCEAWDFLPGRTEAS